MAEATPGSERAGCLKAWLVLLVVVLALGSISYFFAGFVLTRGRQPEAGGQSILLSIAFSVGAVGAAVLLARRRYGFYLLIGSFVFAGLLQFLAAYRVEIAIAALINIALVWWLARPVWSGLE